MDLEKIEGLVKIIEDSSLNEFTYKDKDVKITMKEDKLIFTVDTDEDITLEKGLFGARADFFEEVYNIRPVIKRK